MRSFDDRLELLEAEESHARAFGAERVRLQEQIARLLCQRGGLAPTAADATMIHFNAVSTAVR